MNTLLYKAILITYVAKSTRRPFRSAIYRLILIAFVCLILGISMAYFASEVPIAATQTILILVSIISLQLAYYSTYILLYGTIQSIRSQTIYALLHTLPLPKTLLWRASHLPTFLVGTCGVLLCGPTITSILHQQQVSMLFLIPIIACGSLIGIASTASFWTLFGKFGTIAGFAILALEYMLLRIGIINSSSSILSTSCFIGIGLVIAMLGTIAFLAPRRHRYMPLADTSLPHISLRQLPNGFWLLKKIGRSTMIRMNTLCIFTLSALGSVLLWKQHLLFPAFIVNIAAIMIATYTVDIRSMTKAVNPAEITSLRGSRYFIRSGLTASIWASMIAIVPWILAITYALYHLYSPESLDDLLLPICAQLVLAHAAGHCMGTYFAAKKHDIATQCLAGLTAIGIALLPQMPFVQISESTLFLIQWTASAVLYMTAYIFEYHRNPYYWKEQHRVTTN